MHNHASPVHLSGYMLPALQLILPLYEKTTRPLPDGLTLSYVEYGAGKPVIFIPGWTYTVKVFARNLPVFAEHYRVLAYDPRSHGDSSVTATATISNSMAPTCMNLSPAWGSMIASLPVGPSAHARRIRILNSMAPPGIRGFISIDEPPKIRKETASDWGEGKEDELQAGMEMLTNHGSFEIF